MTDDQDANDGTDLEAMSPAESAAFERGRQVERNLMSAEAYQRGYNDGVEASLTGAKVHMNSLSAELLKGLMDARRAVRWRQESKARHLLSASIADVGFTRRTFNILMKANLRTIEDVLEYGADALAKLDANCFAEVLATLDEIGYKL